MKQIKPILKNLYRTAQFLSDMDRLEYIRMDANESVDGLPEEFIQNVLKKVTPDMLAAYPNPRKCTEAVASYLGLDREMVFMTSGSDQAIKMFFEVYIGEGDRVVIASPAFEMYEVYCNMFGGTAVNVLYKEEFAFPMDEYLAEIRKGAKLAIITNPNNPTGSVISEDEVKLILDAALENDTLVMIDEAYFWIYGETMLPLIEKYSNVVLMRTFSKLLGLAGVRLGFAVANQEMIQDLKKVAASSGVNTIALLFGEEIMTHPYIIDELIKNFKREKQYFKEKMRINKIEYIDTESNYLLIPISDNPRELVDKIKEEGVLVSCKMGRYIRVNVGNENAIDKFIAAYKKAVTD